MSYRDNVCAVIGPRVGGSVLVCHRIGFPDREGWQFPQGGIDPAEDLIGEMKRELLEEIGTDRISVVSIAPGLYRYDYPDSMLKRKRGHSGQQQRWVYARFLDDEPDIRFDATDHPAEFDDWRWVAVGEALDLCVPFKLATYREALADLGLYVSQ